MNTMDIDDYDTDYNCEAFAHAVEDLKDQKSAGRDHVGAAETTLHRCIEMVVDARLDSGALSGRKLDDLLEQLLEIENDLCRADGDLADAGPYPGL